MPDGVYSEAGHRSVCTAIYEDAEHRQSTYQGLAKHFSVQQIIEICLRACIKALTGCEPLRFVASFE